MNNGGRKGAGGRGAMAIYQHMFCNQYTVNMIVAL
jgi:hypothetical protein